MSSVTPTDVKEDLPFQTDFLSGLISDGQIQEHIDDGAAEMDGVAGLGSRQYSQMGSTAQRQYDKGVRTYALMKTLDQLGRAGSRAYREAKEAYQAARDRLADNPDLWADEQAFEASNVGADDSDLPSDFSSPSYEF